MCVHTHRDGGRERKREQREKLESRIQQHLLYNPAFGRLKQEDREEFGANLDYTVSLRPAWATYCGLFFFKEEARKL